MSGTIIIPVEKIFSDSVIETALGVARGNEEKYKLAAVVTSRRGTIISTALNMPHKTHPYQSKLARIVGCPEKEYLHAEVAAIIRALSTTSEKLWAIFVARVKGKNLRPALAKPCRVCVEAIRLANIEYVGWTTDSGDVIVTRAKDI